MGRRVSVCYLVFVKPSADARWRDTGVIETNRDTADRVWPGIVRRLRYVNYKLVPQINVSR
jgi:hypothetical protein